MGAAASLDGLPRLSAGTLAELERLPEAAQAELRRAVQSRLQDGAPSLVDVSTPRAVAAPAAAATAEELAAQYTKPAALLAALRDGDVQLLSARWLMARAGYEEEEVEVDFYGRKVKRKQWIKRRDPLPLPCRQEIEAQHPEAIRSADQIERLYGQLKRKNNHGREAPDALPIFSASHCWETRDAPDPEARTLTTIAKVLAGEWGRRGDPESGLPLYALWGFEDVGIFFDYSSLFQNKPIPRTPTQDAAFKRALAGMSMW